MARPPHPLTQPMRERYPYLSDRSLRRLVRAMDWCISIGLGHEEIADLIDEHSTSRRLNVSAFERAVAERGLEKAREQGLIDESSA